MAPGIEMNLAQVQKALIGMDNDARVILKNGNAVQGKTFNNRVTSFLSQASKSNSEIRSALRIALSKKYDSNIVSKVMPDDAFRAEKPLTAREIKQIISISERLDNKEKDMGPDTIKTLLSNARQMHERLSLRGGPEKMGPDDAAALLAQVANAKQAIVAIFKFNGVLPKNLSSEALVNKQSEIDGMDIKQLGPLAQKKVGELRDMINQNMRLLNQHADIQNPRVTVYDDIEGIDAINDWSTIVENQDIAFENSIGKLSEKLQHIIPDNLQIGPEGKHPTGAEAQLAKDKMAYNFDQLLKNNADIRIVLGAINATSDCQAPDKELISEMLTTTSLTFEDQKELQGRLMEIINKQLPNQQNIVFDEKKPLGIGVNGQTFEGTFNGKQIVVKQILSPTLPDQHIQTLAEEGAFQAMGEDNPNIPKIMGVFKDSKGNKCMVMEFVPGKTMRKIFSDTTGRMETLNRAKAGMAMMPGVIRALETMHKNGVAHMDMKLNNVMLNEKTLEAKLIDYGSAVVPDRVPEFKGGGSPIFRSPEACLEQKAHLGSDIFALGMMFYQGVLGKEPDRIDLEKNPGAYEIGGFEKILKEEGCLGNFSESCWREPGMNKMEELIKACWKKDPNARPTSTQLRQALDGEAITPSASNKPGLKKGQLAVLDILKPESPLRQGGLNALTSMLKKIS